MLPYARRDTGGAMQSAQTRPILFWLALAATLCVLATSSMRLAAQQAAPPQPPQLTEQVFRNIQVLKGIPIDTFFDVMGRSEERRVGKECRTGRSASRSEYMRR